MPWLMRDCWRPGYWRSIYLSPRWAGGGVLATAVGSVFVMCCTPQKTVMGPIFCLIFLICINDFTALLVDKLFPHPLFADGTRFDFIISPLYMCSGDGRGALQIRFERREISPATIIDVLMDEAFKWWKIKGEVSVIYSDNNAESIFLVACNLRGSTVCCSAAQATPWAIVFGQAVFVLNFETLEEVKERKWSRRLL